MNASFEILYPDLPLALSRADDRNDAPALAIARVLARADFVPAPFAGFEQAALALCGINVNGEGSPPLAAITAAYDGLVAAPGAILRADPVYLRADTSRVFLFDAPTIGIDAAEADAILALLNDHFGATGVRFLRGNEPGRWYLENAPVPDMATYSPQVLRGQPLEPSLAAMQGLGDLKRVMTEAQMLLHECAINDQRAALGKPPINSVWIWGGGSAPAASRPAPQRILTRDALVLACAAHAGIVATADPRAFDNASIDGDVAVAYAAGSDAGMLESLLVEALRPALAALSAGRVRRVVITTAAGQWVLNRRSMWRWWRSTRGFLERLCVPVNGAGAP